VDRLSDLALLRAVCRAGNPPLPPAAMRLALELAGDDDSSNDLLIEHIESEARLRFGLVAGANLAIFCGASPIKTVGRAVQQLGRRKCRSLLWLLALSDMIRSWPQLHERARQRLWRHSLLTGVLTQQLLIAAGLRLPGDGLSAGMAHDIGHVLLVSPAARLGIVWHEEHDRLAERDVSPAPQYDHCRLGASLLAFWDAPGELVASALHHHDPAGAEPADRPLMIAVRLADLLAEHIDLEKPVRPLRLDAAPAWERLTALEPWNRVPNLHHLAVEQLAESLLVAEHLANLLGG